MEVGAKGELETIDMARKLAIRAAKDLQYDPKCIVELKTAKTKDELGAIMSRYRHNKFD